MKFPKMMLVAAMLLAFAPVWAMAQEEGGEAESDEMKPEPEEIRRLEVKRYLGLPPRVVAKAIMRGVNRDVRFKDTFEDAAPASSAVRTVRLRGRRYRIAAMFRTQNDIVCLIPRGQQDSLQKVGPPDPLRVGQRITIEGTTLGVVRGLRTFLVDRVLTGHEQASTIEHELVLRWPRSRRPAEPIVITDAGEHAVEFPCRHKEEEIEAVQFVVEEAPREAFMEQLRAEREAEREAEEGEEEPRAKPDKRYATYDPGAVYRHIMRRNVLNVQFADMIRGAPPETPGRITLPNGRRLRIGAAFDTYIGITCLVPRANEELVDLAGRVVPGQEVKVWGTTLPTRASYKPMVVDKIELPGTTRPGQSQNVWVVVAVLPGEEKTKRFYQVGSYALDFPCQHVENRVERIVAELREVRVIREEATE